jgi:hypothetical protein
MVLRTLTIHTNLVSPKAIEFDLRKNMIIIAVGGMSIDLLVTDGYNLKYNFKQVYYKHLRKLC